MNAADTALAQGLASLVQTAGDAVTFRGMPVSAVVNWVTTPDKGGERGIPDLSMEQKTRIEIPLCELGSDPKASEIIFHGGRFHRIETVTFTGLSWICECEVST